MCHDKKEFPVKLYHTPANVSWKPIKYSYFVMLHDAIILATNSYVIFLLPVLLAGLAKEHLNLMPCMQYAKRHK